MSVPMGISVPAISMARLGYREIITIANEPGVLYHDIFQSEAIPDNWQGVPIHIIRPEIDPATLGADFTEVTDEGLVEGYQHARGQVVGRSSQNKTVNFTASQPILPAMGNYLPVKITQTFPNSLVGEALAGS